MLEKKSLLIGFIVIEAILYGLILFNVTPFTYILEFGAIFLCAVYAVLCFRKDLKWATTATAILLICIADVFLVLFGATQKIIPLLILCLVQLIFATRIFLQEKKALRIVHISVRAVAIVVMMLCIFFIFKEKADLMLYLAGFIYVNSGLNIIFCALGTKGNTRFLLGLIFLFVRDTLIGLYSSAPYIDLSGQSVFESIIKTDFNFVWLFYVPAIVLMASSLYLTEKQRLKLDPMKFYED